MERPTRREYVTYGGAVVGSGLLAGCGGSDADGESTTDTGTTATETTPAEGGDAAEGSGSYSVEMAPMGEVTFESVPESWMAYFSTYGDMAVALGQQDALAGLIFTDNWPLDLYNSLPGVDVSFEDVPQLFGDSGIDKEAFYEMDADVHLFDPNFIQVLDDSFTDEDFTEIESQVGPIVGNSIRRRGSDWHDYEYYSLYEAFEKVAQVFQQQARYRALRSVHEDLLSTIESSLPAEDERPTVGLLSVNSDFEGGSFYAYPIHDGNGHKQYRDLGIRSAFDDAIDGNYAEWDYEQLLAVDPDALVFQYGLSHTDREGFEERIQKMRDDPVGSQLTAVQNDRLYRGGTSYQGPVINLLQTEVAAKQFYPETFGEWNGLETLDDSEAWLFDHDRVGSIIAEGVDDA